MRKETKIKEALSSAKAITWDGCHKIYLAMDDHQVELFLEYGYDPIILVNDLDNVVQLRPELFLKYGYDPIILVNDIDKAYETLCGWYDDSCGLRFVQSVKTVIGDPNSGFVRLIPQCDEDESEWETPASILWSNNDWNGE